MVKIGLISAPFLPSQPSQDNYGGIETATANLAQQYDKMGHEVHLFAAPGSYEPPHGELHSIARIYPAIDASIPLIFRDYLEDDNHRKAIMDMDIIHDHCIQHPGKQLILHGLIYNYCLTDHCLYPDDDLIYDSICRIGCSKSHADFCHKIAGTDWKYVYNGVSLNDEQFNSHERNGRLLFFSRIAYSKGPDIAIKIADEAKMPIDIVGGDKQPQNERVRQYVRGLCIKSEYAHYVGEVDYQTKQRYFREASAVILPVRLDYFDPFINMQQHWQEPGCVIPLEANACGTPIITCPYGSLAEYVEEGKTGLFGETIDDFVDNLRLIDGFNKQYLRRYVEEKFSYERVANDYLKLYEDILKGAYW
jgi:glycosyltransferase involved in cell wall biosynthesis